MMEHTVNGLHNSLVQPEITIAAQHGLSVQDNNHGHLDKELSFKYVSP